MTHPEITHFARGAGAGPCARAERFDAQAWLVSNAFVGCWLTVSRKTMPFPSR